MPLAGNDSSLPSQPHDSSSLKAASEHLPQDFEGLLARTRSGDDTAAALLVEMFGSELRRYIRFKLSHPGVRRFLDSLDICQSVLAVFFVRLREGRLDVVNSRQLAHLLEVIAENKVRDKIRRHHAQRRGSGLPVASLDVAGLEPLDRDSDPAEVVAGRELVTAIVARLPVDSRAAVVRWMSGEGWAEIAGSLGGTPEAVRKQVGRSIERAAKELGLIEESL